MFTPYHAKFSACSLLLKSHDEAGLARSLASGRIDMKPHQIDAALFALDSPLTRGAILADEVGLGKTIEAGIVIAQRWAERRRRILLVVPASLRKQWTQELADKFGLPSLILEQKTYSQALRAGTRPFEPMDKIILTSYEFAARSADELKMVPWDLVVFDEAHRMRNVYRDSGSARAKRLKEALAGRFKLLLTATPFQNSLMELFGLASIIDDDIFGDIDIFRILYPDFVDPRRLASLRKRMTPIYIRHLRKDVQAAGHVAFTERRVLTLDFEAGVDEVRLYEEVSVYLRRSATFAFGDPPNPLVLSIARKILGSSTAAIVGFLETVLDRLRKRRALDAKALNDVEDAEDHRFSVGEVGFDPLSAQLSSGPTNQLELDGEARRQALAAEIAEVEGYLILARSIGGTAKGDILAERLPDILESVVINGGERKAVIFTESVRTQRYLAEILSNGAFAGRVVLMNGSNADAESRRRLGAWRERHAGTDAISGSRSADMKAAIVAAFKGDDTTLLIATESGAEGINLQFCSLIVNFDLPWNPQRVEQRIGRCHRYGQRLDVTVINFLNRRNKVEQRVYDLLSTKFHLFAGVFGASDDVLGTVASGLDFERAVVSIAQSCRADAEIEAAFAHLEAELDQRIAADLAEVRRKVLDRLDEGIVARLQSRGEAMTRLLQAFERHLLIVAWAELGAARFHKGTFDRFDLNGVTWTTDWRTADQRGWSFFRLGDSLFASSLVDVARSRTLTLRQIVFDPIALTELGLPSHADVLRLRGRCGWLRVTSLQLDTKAEGAAPREALIVAALADDGEVLAPETVEHLFLTPGSETSCGRKRPPLGRLEEIEQTHRNVLIETARRQNVDWLDSENDQLDAWADDLMRAADERAKSLAEEVTRARRTLRGARVVDPEARVREQRRIAALQVESDTLVFESFVRAHKLRMSVRENLDRMEESLEISASTSQILTIRWEVKQANR